MVLAGSGKINIEEDVLMHVEEGLGVHLTVAVTHIVIV
jgi:hypothetical protein